MREKFGHWVRAKAVEKFLDNVKEAGPGDESETLHTKIDRYLQLWNMAPTYVCEHDEHFAEMREKLNTEPGVVIANHPGYIDVPAILKCLTRQDVKFMVGRGDYQKLRDILGEQYILPANKDTLEVAVAHIREGGVFVIFPTGGGDQVPPASSGLHTEDILFRNGFSKLLEQMRPEDMVYSFHFDPDAVSAIADSYKMNSVGAASALYFGDEVNPNRAHETKRVPVEEKYSTAREWQEVCEGAKNLRDENARLTEHYKEVYGIPDVMTKGDPDDALGDNSSV